MTTETWTLLIVAVASLLALAETLREVFRDGPAAQRPPHSHEQDQRFAPPSSWAA